MRLSAPKKGTFTLSLLVGAVAIALRVLQGIELLEHYDFILLALAFIVLALGALLKGL
ncbi:MAG TPA: hypothetical protein VMX14_11525 [Anaerolineae bacterium]|nr:hypothetical protein [Anaerolineae bacterium]